MTRDERRERTRIIRAVRRGQVLTSREEAQCAFELAIEERRGLPRVRLGYLVVGLFSAVGVVVGIVGPSAFLPPSVALLIFIVVAFAFYLPKLDRNLARSEAEPRGSQTRRSTRVIAACRAARQECSLTGRRFSRKGALARRELAVRSSVGFARQRREKGWDASGAEVVEPCPLRLDRDARHLRVHRPDGAFECLGLLAVRRLAGVH